MLYQLMFNSFVLKKKKYNETCKANNQLVQNINKLVHLSLTLNNWKFSFNRIFFQMAIVPLGNTNIRKDNDLNAFFAGFWIVGELKTIDCQLQNDTL